jgi:hypothetical protein
MISFSLTNKEQTIQIDVDDAGISILIDALNSLRGSGSHTHLWAPSCGGKDLSDKTPFGGEAFAEVIITHGGD